MVVETSGGGCAFRPRPSCPIMPVEDFQRGVLPGSVHTGPVPRCKRQPWRWCKLLCG